MNNIGAKIKAIRKENGLNQKQLALEMTVTQSYICQVETGKTVPTSMFIKLFCLQFSIEESVFKS